MSGCFSHGNIMGLSIVISHHKNWDNTGISTIFNGNHRKTRKENWGFKGFTSRDLPSGNLLYSELEKKTPCSSWENSLFQWLLFNSYMKLPEGIRYMEYHCGIVFLNILSGIYGVHVWDFSM